MVSVRRARPDDSQVVARLHRETVPWGLLSQFGDEIVRAFYRALLESKHAFAFLAEERGVPVGFAAGTTDWSRLLPLALRRMIWPLLRALPTLLRSGRWRRLVETARYTQSGHEGVMAEFLAFGVSESAAGRVWAGSALMYAGLKEFRRRGVARIRGVVWNRNERAMQFFQAVGFKFVSEVAIHPGEVSKTFVVDLAASPLAR